MKKSKKTWLIVAAVFVAVGIAAVAFALIASGGTLGDRYAKYEDAEYEVIDDFDNISILTTTDDIEFVRTEDGNCKVVCREREGVDHSVKVKDGTLTIESSDTRKWYEQLTLFSFGSPSITVYLPRAEYASLIIDERTGDILIPDRFVFKNIGISATTGDVNCHASASGQIKIALTTGGVGVKGIFSESLDVSVSTGVVVIEHATCDGSVTVGVSTGITRLGDITCKNLTSTGSTGSMVMKNVVAEKISVERSTGDVKFDACDAGEIYAKTTTGDITGTLLSEKIFIAKTSTGSVDVPPSAVGGRCELTTKTGDIKISVAP